LRNDPAYAIIHPTKEVIRTYKVIVVDDEDSVRQGISRHIDWRGLGFEIVGDADNGADALELAESALPDLVITDIKMPYMDGLELTARLRAALPAVKVIIISGFDDFEYAKQAISLNIAEYVLKPVNVEELSDVLRRVRGEMEREEASIKDMEKLRAYYEKSLPTLREHFLASLLEGRVSDDRAGQLAATYGLTLTSRYHAAACVRFDRKTAVKDGGDELNRISIRQLIDEALGGGEIRGGIIAYSLIYADYVVAFAGFDDEALMNRLIVRMNEMCGMAEKYLDLVVSVGVGYAVGRLSEMNRSYRGALAALDYSMETGSCSAIYIADVEPDEKVDVSITPQDEQSLLSAIRLADPDAIAHVVNRLIGRLAESRVPYQKYQVYILEIFTALVHIARLNKIDADDMFGGQFDAARELNGIDSLRSLKERLTTLCVRVSGRIRRERQNTSNMLIESAKAYAAEHYRDPEFSVDSMCRDLHVSPAYFSTIFKRAQNTSFVNYLTSLRLAEAVRLLTETDYKTHHIANAVGFGDANYFSFVFKKRFGASPSKYRGRLGGDAHARG
jgi:two-component system response regulator YesN